LKILKFVENPVVFLVRLAYPIQLTQFAGYCTPVGRFWAVFAKFFSNSQYGIIYLFYGVGDSCHAVPQIAVGRYVCSDEVGKLLVGKGSDSSLRSE
jgi:hypothetical protein